MNIDAKDLRKLQGSLALFLVLTAVGAASVWWTRAELAGAEKATQAAATRHKDAENRLKRVRDEELEIKSKSALYRDLVARGIIGPEQRLEWIELVSDIRRDLRLFAPDYEFSPQQTLGTGTGAYQFRGSPMGLRLPLLHEGDLLNFLAEVQQRAPALVQPRSCQIERQPPSGDRSGIQPNLHAVCTLHWITISTAPEGAR